MGTQCDILFPHASWLKTPKFGSYYPIGANCDIMSLEIGGRKEAF
jgi:hypothetical protein